jgi:hypothetical protein
MLIVYPHGLGDLIMLTPALRAYFHRTGKKVSVAILNRFRGCGLLDNCPYIEDILYVKDPWNESTRKLVMQEGRKLAKSRNLTPLCVWHPPGEHKIVYNLVMMGVEPFDGFNTEVYISDADRRIADEWLGDHGFTDAYGFVQTSTGVRGKTNAGGKKDLTPGWGARYMRHHGVERVVEIGIDFQYDEMPIPAQFVIMACAEKICIPDSVFYHAACALNKKVDLVFFGRGKGVYERVRAMHDVRETVVWSLPTL